MKNSLTRKFLGDLAALTHEALSSGSFWWSEGWTTDSSLTSDSCLGLSYDYPAASYSSSCGRNHALLWQPKGWTSAELLGMHYGQHLDSRQLLGVLHDSYVATLPWSLTTAPADGSDLDEHPAD